MFRHFTGLTMLRKRPFDIYVAQEDVFGPGYFFTRHNPVFLLPYNTLLILLQDNTKPRTIAFDLSWIFFSEKKKDGSTWIFLFCSFGKATYPPHKNQMVAS